MLKQFKRTISILLIAGLGGIAGASVYSSYFIHSQPLSYKNDALKQHVQLASFTGNRNEAVCDLTKAADMSVHAVIHVKTFYNSKSSNGFGSDPFQNFFGNPYHQQQPEEASGSGVIITDDGYIVTNNHVVDDADKVEVTLNDNRTFTAKVIGTDPSTDLALIKINEKGLPFIVYGNSDDLKVGEWVLAV